MGEIVHIDPEALPVAMAAWTADVPKTVVIPELATASGVTDAATAEVMEAIAHWPGMHAAMSTARGAKASALHNATVCTTANLTAADDDGAAHISTVGEV